MCVSGSKEGNSNLLKMYYIYTRSVSHSVFVFKVWSCKTSDAVALQPWRPEHAEDGCGYHFHIGCEGICPVVLFMHPLARFFASSWTRLLLPVVHRADSSAGSGAVHSEGEILFYALLSFTKKRQIFLADILPPPRSNSSTSWVRRLLRAWWTPPSNLHWVHFGTSLMSHQQPAAILLRTRVWTCLLKFSRYTKMSTCRCK